MKIKRFQAQDMRQTMRQVREEQGADAAILSTRRSEGGIQIITAVDYDEDLIRDAAGFSTPSPVFDAGSEVTRHMQQFPETLVDLLHGRSLKTATQTPRSGQRPAAAQNVKPKQTATNDAGLQSELRELRRLLETQVASLAWNEFGRRQPQHARIFIELTRMGIESDIARDMLKSLPEHINAEQSRYLPLGLLARKLCIRDSDILDQSGIRALVGPTGVGKTTTVAKLAARYVKRHGPEGVALIAADHFRVGADEQIYRYARMLGVPVYAATTAAELQALIGRLAGHRLVLLDTPGLGYRDEQISELLQILAHVSVEVRISLVLAANIQVEALQYTVSAYAQLSPDGCILTKLDEASTLGGAFSVLIRHHLVLDFITAGQRVPEDLEMAQAHKLVCRAVRQQTGLPLDAEMLAERFGGLAATGT